MINIIGAREDVTKMKGENDVLQVEASTVLHSQVQGGNPVTIPMGKLTAGQSLGKLTAGQSLATVEEASGQINNAHEVKEIEVKEIGFGSDYTCSSQRSISDKSGDVRSGNSNSGNGSNTSKKNDKNVEVRKTVAQP